MSQLRDSTTKKDLENITPSIIELVDKWQSKGKFIWSGPLSDEKTGMAIFEATEEEAEEFHEEYGKICSGILGLFPVPVGIYPISLHAVVGSNWMRHVRIQAG